MLYFSSYIINNILYNMTNQQLSHDVRGDRTHNCMCVVSSSLLLLLLLKSVTNQLSYV